MKRHLPILLLSGMVMLTGCTEWHRDGKGYYKVGSPYEMFGQKYTPKEDPFYEEEGMASWYGSDFHGNSTANGEKFDKNKITAAHRTLPMPSIVKVTNLENGKTLAVRVNDRGPFSDDRILDLSEAAAKKLGVWGPGTAKVKVEFDPVASRELLLAEGHNTEAIRRIEMAMTTKDIKTKQPATSKLASSKLASADNFSDAQFNPSAGNNKKFISPLAKQKDVANANNYYIQLGAYESYPQAVQVRDRLSHIAPVRLKTANMSGAVKAHKVQLGPFIEVSKLDIDRLHSLGFKDAIIIKD